MKIYVIYLNQTEGMVLVYADSEERAMELFLKNEASPIHTNGLDLDGIKIDIYSTRMHIDTTTEEIGDYCVSTDL
jgi:hypothetical protein